MERRESLGVFMGFYMFIETTNKTNGWNMDGLLIQKQVAPSGYDYQFAMVKPWPIEIDHLPIKNGYFPWWTVKQSDGRCNPIDRFDCWKCREVPKVHQHSKNPHPGHFPNGLFDSPLYRRIMCFDTSKDLGYLWLTSRANPFGFCDRDRAPERGWQKQKGWGRHGIS